MYISRKPKSQRLRPMVWMAHSIHAAQIKDGLKSCLTRLYQWLIHQWGASTPSLYMLGTYWAGEIHAGHVVPLSSASQQIDSDGRLLAGSSNYRGELLMRQESAWATCWLVDSKHRAVWLKLCEGGVDGILLHRCLSPPAEGTMDDGCSVAWIGSGESHLATEPSGDWTCDGWSGQPSRRSHSPAHSDYHALTVQHQGFYHGGGGAVFISV